MISAILLAAGQSTRMAPENKLLLPFRGKTLLEHMVDVLTQSRAGETIVVLGHEAERVRPLLAGKPVRIALAADHAQGMSASIRAGVGSVSDQAEAVMVCLTDLPLIEPADLDRLIDAFEGAQNNGASKSIVVPRHQGQRGNPVLFSLRHREEVLAGRGALGGWRGIVKSHPSDVLEVDMETDHVVRDIDTPEDYRALIAAERPA